MKQIPLSKGLHAYVSDEDYELVSQFNWHVYDRAAIKKFGEFARLNFPKKGRR